MLRITFDPRKPLRVVIYARMSSDKQNRRSPDQQIAEIKKRIKTQGYKWVIVKIYRDDAKSGRFLRKRPSLQGMFRDIKTGMVMVDAILVDTIERFGRVDELPVLRKELFEKFGVVVLSADTNFCDPTTPQGRAMASFEAMRATDDTRIKAHNVVRGKRDAAERKFWPGGPIPFGLRSRTITSNRGGKIEIEGSVLEPDPETSPIIKLVFGKAHDSGHGQTRLARWLNDNPDVPAKFKPFHSATVGEWLKSAIYKGVLEWGEVCTGVIDDVRVTQPNPEEELLVVPDFCEPLVDVAVWDTINAVRQARADRISKAREQEEAGKHLTAPAPGMTVKYLLTGLLRCGHCGRMMTASSSPPYTTKAGETKRYVTYVCPGYLGRICANGKRVPEPWLRQVVISKLLEHFFPMRGCQM